MKSTLARAYFSIEACPNSWPSKTLKLQPNIAELCVVMVTYSTSNHSPQYKYIKLYMSQVLCKFIQKLYSSELETVKFKIFLSLIKTKYHTLLKFFGPLFMVISYERVLFCQFHHYLLSEINIKSFKCYFHLVLELWKCSNFYHLIIKVQPLGSSLALTISS